MVAWLLELLCHFEQLGSHFLVRSVDWQLNVGSRGSVMGIISGDTIQFVTHPWRLGARAFPIVETRAAAMLSSDGSISLLQF